MISQIRIADEIINTVGHDKNFPFKISSLGQGMDNFISVDGRTPIRIEIKCFVSSPPPSGFKSCPECGTFTVASGQIQSILLNEEILQKTDLINLHIVDGDNDIVDVRARIKGLENILTYSEKYKTV